MKQIDKKKVENWRPYALLTLTAGAITAAGVLFGLVDRIGELLPNDSTYAGSVNGLGGFIDRDNVAFAKFLERNIGNIVNLDLQIHVYGPADETAPNVTCQKYDEKDHPIPEELRIAWWTQNARVIDLYQIKNFHENHIGFQEDDRSAGNTFAVSYNLLGCDTYIVEVPDRSIHLVSAGAHGVTVSVEGRFRVAHDVVEDTMILSKV
jgi:hypothetical protein